ncbi:MAG: hypothetical protein ACRECQ_10925, partial [Burkholderiaceae bacterium]
MKARARELESENGHILSAMVRHEQGDDDTASSSGSTFDSSARRSAADSALHSRMLDPRIAGPPMPRLVIPEHMMADAFARDRPAIEDAPLSQRPRIDHNLQAQRGFEPVERHTARRMAAAAQGTADQIERGRAAALQVL